MNPDRKMHSPEPINSHLHSQNVSLRNPFSVEYPCFFKRYFLVLKTTNQPSKLQSQRLDVSSRLQGRL